MQEYDQSIDTLKKAINMSPDNPYAHYYLGMTLAPKGLYDEAYDEYDYAVRLEPNIATTYKKLKGKLSKKVEMANSNKRSINDRETIRLSKNYISLSFASQIPS